MRQNGEVIYSVDQINLPAELPDILKNYTKFILRTQPKDILAASAEYFAQQAKSPGSVVNKADITDSQLESFYLAFQGKPQSTASIEEISAACGKAGISDKIKDECLSLGSWTEDVNWLGFWVLIVFSTRTTMPGTMRRCFQVISGGRSEIAKSSVSAVSDFLHERDPNVDSRVVEGLRHLIETSAGDKIPMKELLQVVRAE